MQRFGRATSVLLLIATGLAAPAFALTDEEVFRNFRFNLINPGARSLALGGAFISLADDATAAQANPAGLGFLTRWEVFGELRSIDSGVQASVSQPAQPFGGFDTEIATASDIEDSVTPSFLSGVLTFRKGLRWSLGFSRQELLNINNATINRFTFTRQGLPGTFVEQGVGVIDLNVLNWNASAGFRIGDRWGVGLTLTWSQLDVSSAVTNKVINTGGLLSDLEPVLESTLDVRTTVDDTDDDVVFSLGLIYKRSRWGAGAVYRKGPEFAVQQQVLLTDEGETVPTGIDVFGLRAEYGDSIANEFSLPDVLGIGGHWQTKNDRLTLALNVDRVMYSNLMDNFVSGVNVLTDYDARFEIDDATDVRFGAEYVFLPKGRPLALRGGVYTEGNSTIRALDTGGRSFVTEDVFASGDDQVHGTIGLGINFKRGKIDLAADFAEVVNQFVISFIYQGKSQPRSRP